jgi:preprotein translocase subunit SecD
VLFAVVVLCVYLVASRGIPLGLDLRGGTQIVLQVLTDDVLNAHTEATLETIRRDVIPRIGGPAKATSTDAGEIRVAGLASSALEGQVPAWDATPHSEQSIPATILRMRPAEKEILREEATIQTMRVIENRLNGDGLSEITIQRYGEPDNYEIQIQIPGGFDPERIRELIRTTGLLEFRIVEHGPFKSTQAAAAAYQGAVPADVEILPYRENGAEAMFYVIHRSVPVAGRHLRTVSSSLDPAGRPAVAFTLNNEGAERFGKFTGDNIDRQLAIVLDGVVQSTATIESKIENSGIIQGGSAGFTAEQVRDLIVVLRSGALPARTRTSAEQVIGPSLGEDSIRSGIAASSIALAAVSGAVVAYYRKAGINAVVAMLFNLLILLGVMAYFQAPLTLPGIAGIVLTIGMGIDSNVLIFERIREELRSGKAAAVAIAAGFHRVFRTLIDTHLAAMISAAILFMFSSGPVRGFAVSLAIGLVSNLFTSIFVSRTLFNLVRTKDQMSI